ncbi:MAG: hypothetical protein DMD25_11115 [Gemmatimonadetes bacterium]|nr:MAG: hypothetical protein DMD25_11115 [Gemmatimonadota bacterium]
MPLFRDLLDDGVGALLGSLHRIRRAAGSARRGVAGAAVGSDLAARQHCVRSNITQLVDRLEKDGLVRRRPDPEDRRSVLAELTPAGQQAHAKGVRALAEAQRAIVRALKAGEATSLQNALTALTS